MKLAIYPGSFDPLTNGHIDIIKRGLCLFDRVVVAVGRNAEKQHLFSLEERLQLVRTCTLTLERVEVEDFEGLLVDFVRQKGACCILRGLRAVSDFEYEFQMAAMNRQLDKGVETVFMMTGSESFYVSSRLVREVATLGGSVEALVPKAVQMALNNKLIR